MLPAEQKCKGEPLNFPTEWQAVIFRNYGYVSIDKIAATLGCSEHIVREEARRLGLFAEDYNPDWEAKGYITLIRNNWFLLPYSQLMMLLGIGKDKLEFILEKEDFLYLKLGGFKPELSEVRYSPLTKSQLTQTAVIAEKITRLNRKREILPFDFFNKTSQNDGVPNERTGGARIVHGYLSPCGDVFAEDCETYLPDSLLAQYQKQGVNGLWFHGLLSALSPYPFDEQLSKGYEERRKELKKLISRCKKYGIKVYLYLNEPRGLSKNKIGKYAYLVGRTEGDAVGLCIEKREVKEYLYGAVKDLLTETSELGGIITITMSENLTHCNYRPRTNCPICKNIPAERSAAEVNNIIMRAVRDSGSECELIANLWGWSPFMDWTEEQTMRGIELLDKDISVMCVSEYDLEISKGGVKSRIIDYSISNPGPSAISRKIFAKARREGHKLYAKIQINNSWECSAAPSLPVYDLVYEHLDNLRAEGVGDYMLTWTLGGYPSEMMRLVNDYVGQAENFSLDEWYKSRFGERFEEVKQAVSCFSRGFREFPFSIESLYYSPKTLGVANLWSLEQSEKQSTMVCFSYDDYENWIKPYPYEIYVSQYEKLLQSCEKAISVFESIGEGKVSEITLNSKAAYIHFKSDLLQTQFSYYKRDAKKRLSELMRILQQEKEIVIELLEIICKNPTIGYEASNHYFYNERNLIEKYINIEKIEDELNSEAK